MINPKSKIENRKSSPSSITINSRHIGPGWPVYIIAEMSANHGQDLEQARQILRAAKRAGADAVKLQTYTPDTMTIDCDQDWFQIRGTLWNGHSLYELYGETYTPWEWLPALQGEARALGLDLFSTPFDATAVDFLEAAEVPAYKVASFELIDLPLLRRIAQTGKPIILSTGMGTREEIAEAIQTIRSAGGGELALLRCTSAYPAPIDQMHLRTIPDLAASFGLPVGLSDHTLGITAPVAAVAIGACIIEKHFTLSRQIPGPDSAFSLEPEEFAAMVAAVRDTESALGCIHYGSGESEAGSLVFRRSLFVVEDIEASQEFTPQNVRCIRPGYGLPPRYFDAVVGRRAACPLSRGTPLAWQHIKEI